jgi:tetrahydromethanopterin S-methyltransferase subunit G
LIKPGCVKIMVILVFLFVLSACVTEDKFLYLSKRIDAIEAKTDKELLSNSERMASNSAEMDRVKEEMRFLNGRLDENSHLLKRSIERDTTEGDALGESVSDLRKRMDRLELRVDRISSYLGLEPVIPPDEKGAATIPCCPPGPDAG